MALPGFLDPQGSVAAAQSRNFFLILLVLLVFVAAPVFMVLAWFVWRYRYGTVKPRYTPQWQYNRWLELATWSGPVVIVAILSVVVWRDTHALDPYRPLAAAQPPLRVQAIGYDWKWLFVYPDYGIASVGVMPMRAGQPVALQLTSATVMQSLHIPALGGQIYAMGGMVTRLHLQAWKPGQFNGGNTMYNGDGFYQQRFRAEAMPPDRFDAWVAQAQVRGVRFDDRVRRLLLQRDTRASLAQGLGIVPDRAARDGLQLSAVPPGFFAAVVRATRGLNLPAPATPKVAP
jgi:cytochrome o ubiquinol oxidase subunit 2